MKIEKNDTNKLVRQLRSTPYKEFKEDDTNISKYNQKQSSNLNKDNFNKGDFHFEK